MDLAMHLHSFEAPDAKTCETICVIDDDALQCGALAGALRRQGFAVQTFLSATDFLNSSPSLSDGAIVADVNMPGLTGIDLLTKLREMGATAPVILITGQADIPLAIRALKSGAADFLEKPISDRELLSSVLSAIREAKRAAARDWQILDALRRLERLTDRERVILDCLVEGHANKVIARELNLSPRTVEAHRASIMHKTRAESFSALIKLTFLAATSP
jgi:two-component system response regulator FixJ